MNPYAIVVSGIGGAEATSLRARLMAWHDSMVAHERRLRAGETADACDDECPHVEARPLWAEASAMLGSRAGELAFLRSRALDAPTSSDHLKVSAKRVWQRAEAAPHSRAARVASARRQSTSFADSVEPSQMATAEL
jgi:hypothetical protein